MLTYQAYTIYFWYRKRETEVICMWWERSEEV